MIASVPVAQALLLVHPPARSPRCTWPVRRRNSRGAGLGRSRATAPLCRQPYRRRPRLCLNKPRCPNRLVPLRPGAIRIRHYTNIQPLRPRRTALRCWSVATVAGYAPQRRCSPRPAGRRAPDTRNSVSASRGSNRRPERPCRKASRKCGKPTPFGATTPIPVTTTRFISVLPCLDFAIATRSPPALHISTRERIRRRRQVLTVPVSFTVSPGYPLANQSIEASVNRVRCVSH